MKTVATHNENKQNAIVKVLEKRVLEGYYKEKLPRTLDLADEFKVNFKTLNKAIMQLVDKGLVYRKPGRGTFINYDNGKVEDSLIELLFVGSSEMSVHPFFSEMWSGILDSLKGSAYKVVLTMLEEDPKCGGLKEVCKKLTASAGKILIGTNNIKQIRILKRAKVPFILLGDTSSEKNVISVYCDCSKAVKDAVDFLQKKGTREIAFIGQTCDNGEHLCNFQIFLAYLDAIQKKGEINSDLIENTPPFANLGYNAMKNILKRKTPQAVILSFDHLAEGVYQAISEAGLKIPDDIKVVSIEGTNPQLIPELTNIKVEPHYKAGLLAGQKLLRMIRTSGKQHTSSILKAEFDPAIGKSI